MGILNVEMTQELFDRSIKGSPRDAVKELIWNACDADAHNIDISFELDGLAGAEDVVGIYVTDDGHGIPFSDVEEYFGKYGCSQKTYSDRSPSGRIYHGKLGQGRYKSLAAGTFVDWKTTFREDDDTFSTYEIQINADTRRNVKVSDNSEPSPDNHSGTTAHIHGIPEKRVKMVNKLSDNESMVPEMLATFAPYLLAYPDVSIRYNGIRLDPNVHIKKKQEKMLVYQESGKEPVYAKVCSIQWRQSQFSKFYICGASGVVFMEKELTILKKRSVSIYLLGELFETMHRENTLEMGAVNPAYGYFEAEVKKYIREVLGELEDDEAANEVLKVKKEGLYPYSEEAIDALTKAEREVFDVLAVQVNRAVPQLRKASRQAKKLTYQLMREAINTNPSSIKAILTEVFNLSQQQQDDLAALLTYTHLPEIIDVAKTVSDRLLFIRVLEEMVYNDSIGKAIKERSQFHKILLRELWIFGDKYELGTSDQSLKNVLKSHIYRLGRSELVPEIPPEAAEDLTRIPDICLFEQICPGYEQFEHLVIELKRPTFTLTKKELDQIEDYALSVSEEPLFDKEKTNWHFILLGQDFNTYVANRLRNRTQGIGNMYNSDDGHVAISVLKWSTVIQQNKFRYEFLRKKLNQKLSDDPSIATDYLFQKYAELFPDKTEAN